MQAEYVILTIHFLCQLQIIKQNKVIRAGLLIVGMASVNPISPSEARIQNCGKLSSHHLFKQP